MSQQHLADRMRELGWRWVQPTVWSIEAGRRPLRLAEAADLADVLGVEVDAFLTVPYESPIERLNAGLVADAATVRRRRDDAERRLQDILTRHRALTDLARAREGQAVRWPDGARRVWDAFEWIDSEEARDILEHLGVEAADAERLAALLERGQADGEGPDTAGSAAADFATAAWDALRVALPSLVEAGPA